MKVSQPQRQKVFFDPTPQRLRPDLPTTPTEDQIRMMLAENNKGLPLNRIVVGQKNEAPMHILRLGLFTILQRHNHSARGQSFGIFSGPGQGKTTIAKLWAASTGLPTVLIQSSSLKSTWQLFQAMRAAFEKEGCPLVPQSTPFHFVVPPCIVIFDEAHDLPVKLRTGGLLNPMEANDGWLVTAEDKKNSQFFHVDCREVCWIAASTDPGRIYAESEAFYDRFKTHIVWHSATRREIALIIKGEYQEMPVEACQRVAFYQRNPRKAKAFAEQVIQERKLMKSDWTEAARRVAQINQIDEYGMHVRQLSVLTALAQRPIAKKNLCVYAKCRPEELDNMVLPPLLEEDEEAGHGPLIGTTHKGFALTMDGLEEVKRRGLAHNSNERAILVEYITA